MSDVKHNKMGPVLDPTPEAKAVFHCVKEKVIDKLKEVKFLLIIKMRDENMIMTILLPYKLKHEDNVHPDFHVMDDLKKIDFYKLKNYAVEEVSYGYNYFGKIEIDEEKYIHVRCHKYHDDPENERVDFYSILTEESAKTGERTAIWPIEEPLKYFID